MDTDRIRALFVITSINRACQDTEGHLAAHTAREFRRYLEWHPDALPEPDRSAVSAQLSELERLMPHAVGSPACD